MKEQSEAVIKGSEVEAGQRDMRLTISEPTEVVVSAGSGVKDAELRALYLKIQKLKDKKRMLNSRNGDRQKTHTDALFKMRQLRWQYAVLVNNIRVLRRQLEKVYLEK